MEQGEGLLDDVAELAQALDVRGALAGDHRLDAAASQLTVYQLPPYAPELNPVEGVWSPT